MACLVAARSCWDGEAGHDAVTWRMRCRDGRAGVGAGVYCIAPRRRGENRSQPAAITSPGNLLMEEGVAVAALLQDIPKLFWRLWQPRVMGDSL